MLADPDMEKVMGLVNRLSKFHWSLKPPEQCVLPDGSGIGRIAYDNMAAFNIAWCYYKPKCIASHNEAITATIMLRRPLAMKYNSLTLEDAVMLLSKDAFSVWLNRYRFSMDDSFFLMLHSASANRETL